MNTAAGESPLGAARRLLDDLHMLNRASIAPSDRVRVIEQHREAAIGALASLDQVYSTAPQPLPTIAREALALARALANEMAIGYRTAVADKTAEPAAFDSKQRIPLLLFRAMEFAQEALRSSYRSRTPVPMGVWKGVHDLYLLAVAQEVAELPADPSSEASIATLYSELILTAVADPFGLGPDDIDRVRFHLRTTRAPVLLAQAKPSTPQTGHFLVPCDQDKPPKPALSADGDRGGPNWRILDASTLVERLRARRQALESGHISPAARQALGADALALLDRLILLWSDPPRRASRREPMETTVALCIGLEAAAYFVANEAQADLSSEARAIQSGRTLPLLWLGDDRTRHPFAAVEWEVVDASEGGFKVRRQGASTTLAIGDIVGIRRIAHQRWAVGVVRWTRLTEYGVEAGLQLLSPSARRVSVQSTQNGRASREALLLEHAGLVRSSEPLLAPAGTHADLRELRIDDEGRIAQARATTLIERGAGFDLFLLKFQ